MLLALASALVPLGAACLLASASVGGREGVVTGSMGLGRLHTAGPSHIVPARAAPTCPHCRSPPFPGGGGKGSV